MKYITSAVLFVLVGFGYGQMNPPTLNRDGTVNKIAGIGITQKLGADVPLGLTFTDENGQQVRLSQFFGRRPVLLNLIFYKCHGVCSLELEGLTESFAKMSRNGKTHALIGQDLDVVTISIDPNEGPDLAKAKRDLVLSNFSYPSAKDGWHFLTGDADNLNKLVTAVGFQYTYDPRTKGINHPAGVILLSPTGKVTQYFYGNDYPEQPLHDGIALASQEKVGPKAEEILLGCLCRDLATGKYSVNIERTLTVLCLLTVAVVATSILAMSRKSKNSIDDLPPTE